MEYDRTGGMCCFNHIVGLPRKRGTQRPLYDYQKDLYDALMSLDFHNSMNDPGKHKHLWVKKATGLGITEFMLRLMA
jgi:hypothetical protein